MRGRGLRELRVSIGRDLQQEREKREVSLESISNGTKVSVRYLCALEANDYGALPGGVFNKGIVRSYCGFLGLNEEEWLTRWAKTVPSEDAADWSEFAVNVKRTRPETGPRMKLRWWGVALMVVALAGVAWLAWHYVVRPRLRTQDVYPTSARVRRVSNNSIA